MKIIEEQRRELWRQRVSGYVHKKGEKTKKILPILGIFLFVVSGNAQFEKSIIVSMGLGYGIYIVAYSMIARKTEQMIIKGKEGVFRALLLSVQDWGFVAMLTGTMLLAGGLGLKKILSDDIINGRALLIFLFSIFVLASLFFPVVLRYKVKEKKSDDFKYYPQLIALSTAAPGIGLLIAAIIPNTNGVSTQFFMSAFLSSLLGIVLLPYFVWGGYEILVLGLREWPDIKKVDEEVVLVFPDNSVE
jgi:hypothetical protein